MGGRLLDWLGQGNAADRPAAIDVPTLVPANSAVFFYAKDTKILSVYDEADSDWYEIDAAALSTLSFETLPDVDWSTPPTDGQVFEWDTGTAKLVPTSLYVKTQEEFQDAVGAMGVNGTGTTFVYDDGAGTFKFDCTITQYTDELAQDAIGAAFAAGTHVGLTITYDDVGNVFDVEIVDSYVNALADARIAAATLDDLSDVGATAPALGQVPTWDGAKYEPATPPGGVDSYEAGPPGSVFTAASFTSWINQGTSTIADGVDALIFRPQRGTPAIRYAMLGATPAAPFDIYMRAEVTQLSSLANTAFSQFEFGLVFKDNADDELIFCNFGQVRISGDEQVYAVRNIRRMNGANSQTISATPIAREELLTQWQWMHVNVTSTTITFEISPDGKNWIEVGTESIATFVDVVDQYGIGCYSNDAGTGTPAIIISYLSHTAPA